MLKGTGTCRAPREAEGSDGGMDPAQMRNHQCNVLEQVLGLVVDNFHGRVPRWTDFGTFIRLLAVELSSPSVPNVSESQVSLLHLSSQPPLGGVSCGAPNTEHQTKRGQQSPVADQSRSHPRPGAVQTWSRLQLSEAH